MEQQKAPILILDGSKQPFLSIGCRFGGMTVWNRKYIYMAEQDAFLREDFVKKFNAHKKAKGTWEQFIEVIKNVIEPPKS